MLKKLSLVLLVGVLLFSLAACSSSQDETTDQLGDVVALVNSKEILRVDFERVLENLKMSYLQSGIDVEDEELLKVLQEEAVLNLIQEELLLQKALEGNYEVSPEDLENQINNIRTEFGSEEDFLEALQANNLTLEELETIIFNDNMISLYIHDVIGEVSVTEEELTAMYDGYKEVIEDMPSFDEVRAELEDELKYNKFMEALEALIDQLVDENDIEILL